MSSGSRTKRKVIHFPMLRSYLSYCLRSRHGQFLWELPFQVSHVPGQGEVCKGGRIFWNLHSCQRCRLGASWTRRLLSIPTNGRTPPDMWCTRLSMYQGKAPNILHDHFAKKFDCKIGGKIDHFTLGKTIPLDRNSLWGCRNIYSRIVYSRTIYPNIFTLRLNYSLGILPHGILILKYFYSVEI